MNKFPNSDQSKSIGTTAPREITATTETPAQIGSTLLPKFSKLFAAMALAAAVTDCGPSNSAPGTTGLQCLPSRFELVESVQDTGGRNDADYVRDPKYNLCYLSADPCRYSAKLATVPCEKIMPTADPAKMDKK